MSLDDFDPCAGDSLLSDAPGLAEPSEAVKRAIIALARPDMDAHLAELKARLERLAAPVPSARAITPDGPAQVKRRQRKLLFGALRDGASRPMACAAAEISPELFSSWMARPKFRESVDQAEDRAMQAVDNPLR